MIIQKPDFVIDYLYSIVTLLDFSQG